MENTKVNLGTFRMETFLEDLWNKYYQRVNEELSETISDTRKKRLEYFAELLERGFVWADNKEVLDVLITGINPSYCKEDANKHGKTFCFDYQDNVKKGSRYYQQIHSCFIGDELNKQCKIGYIDLFTFKETHQSAFWKLLKEPLGCQFIAEHLAIIQREIERLAPKLIIIKNRGSWMYWGKENIQGEVGINGYNIWMGYKLEYLNEEFGEEYNKALENKLRQVYKITGLLDNNERVASDIQQTNLIGATVLFTGHLAYMKKEYRPTKELVKRLYDLSCC